MDATISNTNNYWIVLKDLSNEVKLDLIARLSNSLIHKEEVKPLSAKRFYGVWKDSKPEDADCLAEEVKAARKFKDDIEAF